MMLLGVGRLGRDGEMRYTPSGAAVVNMSLAFSYGKKDGAGNRPTQWVNAALWGERAEKLVSYLKKGTQLYVALDDVHVREWESNGKSGHSLEARVITLEFIGNRSDNAERSVVTEAGAQAQSSGTPSKQAEVDFDDDIPF